MAGLVQTFMCRPNERPGLPRHDPWKNAGFELQLSFHRRARHWLTSLVFPDGPGNQNWNYILDGRPQTVSVANPGLAVQTAYSYNWRQLLT